MSADSRAGDLAAHILETLRLIRESPEQFATEAKLAGMSTDVLEASVLAGCMFEWAAAGQDGGDDELRREAFAAEARRAENAAENLETVAVAVRLPPLLAIRVLELAGGRKQSVDDCLRTLIGEAVDGAVNKLRAFSGQAPARPWSGSEKSA